MKKIKYDWHTDVELTDDEAVIVCGLGKGEECCAFLAVTGDGFECLRMSSNALIFHRLKEGTSHAKGEGGWKGCAWEGDI